MNEANDYTNKPTIDLIDIYAWRVAKGHDLSSIYAHK